MANMITFVNLICGMGAIFLAFLGHPVAPWLIGAGMILDSFDGRLARVLGQSGQIGKQLDSLVDMVTFGVAPVICVLASFFDTANPVSLLLLAGSGLFSIAGAYRLARFNTVRSASNHFVGLPITWAGGCAAALTLLPSPHQALISAIFMTLLSFLMISNVPYPDMKHMNLSRWAWLVGALSCVVLLGIIAGPPEARMILVFLILAGGILLGPANMVLDNRRQDQDVEA